jgi:CHASE1-domain containing sensor protein
MQKKWVKWVAVILAVVFILTSLGAVGFTLLGQ